MKVFVSGALCVAMLGLVLGLTAIAGGAVICTGDVEPFDPCTWDDDTDVKVGRTAAGRLDVTAGDDIETRWSDIGYYSSGIGEAYVTGSGSTWTSDDLNIGNEGNGRLDITAAGQVTTTSTSYIGNESRSIGKVTVSGGGSEWTINSLYVARYGQGKLDVLAGGSVTCSYGWVGNSGGSSGEAKVDGEGSIWTTHGYFRVGYFGDGLLSITNGGEVKSNYTSEVGYVANADAEVKVDGTNSLWTTVGDMSIGVNNRSLGKLTITGGGTVISETYANLGDNAGAGGEVTVDGAGSSLETDNLRVGRTGTGLLEITNGAEVTSDSWGIVGHYAEAVGRAVVRGAGSSWEMGGCRIGRYGQGTLEVLDGGRVIAYTGSIGHYAGSTGLVKVSGVGSAWAMVSDFNVGGDGTGVLKITDGGIAAAVGMGTMTIDANGGGESCVKISNGGGLAVNGDVSDSLTSFLGVIAGTDAILYWDDSVPGWANITGAQAGVDYALNYVSEGELAGYTLLTVWAGNRIHLEEFALLAQYWQMSGCDETQDCAAADWFADGTIDMFDLSRLAFSWLDDEIAPDPN